MIAIFIKLNFEIPFLTLFRFNIHDNDIVWTINRLWKFHSRDNENFDWQNLKI